MTICELWWPLMTSIFRKNWYFHVLNTFFSQLLLQYGIRYVLRTSKRYIVRWIHKRPDGSPMEATMFNEIKPCMMYILEPLRTCEMYLSTHHGHLLTLVASNGLHFQKKLIFSCIKCIFLNFYFIMALYMPWGPQKGILLGGQIVLQLRP